MLSPSPSTADERPPVLSRRRALRVTVTVAALGAIVWAFVASWDTVSAYDWRFRPGWLLVGCICVLAAYLGNALAYAYGIALLVPRPPERRISVSIWARSIIARYIPGNVMMVIGRVVLHLDHGVGKKATLTATLYEQALGVGLASIGAVIYVGRFGSPGDDRLLWLLLLVPVILAVLHPRVFRGLSTWALRRLGREPVAVTYTGAQTVRLAGAYLVGMALLVVGVWALVRAATVDDVGGPLEVGSAFLLAFVISYLAFIVPSGIGVRDGIFAVALSRTLPLGVAIAISVGVRLALTALELVFVGLATVWGRRR
jgi:hypothetical protein